MTSTLRALTIQMLRPVFRGFLAALVLVAFSGSAWATCVEGSVASETQQMACRKAGHDHCPMKSGASECCKISGPQFQSQATTVAKPFSAAAPVLIVSLTVSPFESVASS